MESEDQSFWVVRPEDLSICELIWKHRGAIFGGYLRDVIAGDIPKDIDVVVSQYFYPDFHSDMLGAGYKGEELYTDIYRYEKEGTLPVEVCICEDHPDNTQLGPCPCPDFDVNLLAYNAEGSYLYNWMTGSDDTRDIAAAIKARVATPIEPTEDRREKILAKGYTIK